MRDDGPLTAGESGPYGEIACRTLPEGLVLLFIPSLAALATRAEELKRADLTREELYRIRDASTVLVSEPEPARATAAQRGYEDLNAGDPWPDWQALKGRAS